MNEDDKDNAIASAEKAGLYYSNNSEPGYTRQIKEEEHIFLDTNGKLLKGKRILKRIEEMRIPPAWTDIWICEEKNGHLQATGIDAKKKHNTSTIAYGLNLEVKQNSIKCPHLEGFYQKLEKNILKI